MAKDPVTNKYASEITHEGVKLTWNAETKGLVDSDDAADFYVESVEAMQQMKTRLESKERKFPMTKACFVIVFLALAAGVYNLSISQLFCHERWCW
jgi:hypothetical protein